MSDEWYTPREELTPFIRHFGPEYGDPCGSAHGESPVTSGAVWSRTVADGEWNALTQPWGDAQWYFVNPPYSGDKKDWIVRCASAAVATGRPVVLMLPDATDTAWYRLAFEWADNVVLRKGRVAFVTPEGAKRAGNTRGSTFFVFGARVCDHRDVIYMDEL